MTLLPRTGYELPGPEGIRDPRLNARMLRGALQGKLNGVADFEIPITLRQWVNQDYVVGDRVHNNGHAYTCIAEVDYATTDPAVTEPGTGSGWQTYWQDDGVQQQGLPYTLRFPLISAQSYIELMPLNDAADKDRSSICMANQTNGSVQIIEAPPKLRQTVLKASNFQNTGEIWYPSPGGGVPGFTPLRVSDVQEASNCVSVQRPVVQPPNTPPFNLAAGGGIVVQGAEFYRLNINGVHGSAANTQYWVAFEHYRADETYVGRISVSFSTTGYSATSAQAHMSQISRNAAKVGDYFRLCAAATPQRTVGFSNLQIALESMSLLPQLQASRTEKLRFRALVIA